jgi:hypothetical protein
MSTDKELLEMAAKAAGVGYADENDKFIPFVPDSWNPLTNSEDAFRLMVRLRLEVYIHENDTRCISGNLDEATENHNGDPYAATRRAIVRAAAAIGKEMAS